MSGGLISRGRGYVDTFSLLLLLMMMLMVVVMVVMSAG